MENMNELANVLGALAAVWVVALVIGIFVAICTWKCYVKMGEPGWACLIPFYNNWVLCKRTWGNGWMMLTYFIPYAGAVMSLITLVKMYKRFGKSTALSVLGTLFFPLILLAICAFDDSVYCEY